MNESSENFSSAVRDVKTAFNDLHKSDKLLKHVLIFQTVAYAVA